MMRNLRIIYAVTLTSTAWAFQPIIPQRAQLPPRNPFMIPEAKETNQEEPVRFVVEPMKAVPQSPDAVVPLDTATAGIPENATTDLGTAIFLANAEKNAEIAAEILMEGSTEPPILEGPVSSILERPIAPEVPPMFELSEPLLSDFPETSEPPQLPTERPVKVTLPPDLLDIPAMVSNTGDASVDAVLAASGEAAAAAEASLQTPEKLEFNEEEEPIHVILAESKVNQVVEKKEESTPAVKQPPIHAPSLMKLLKFAVPAIGVWLCNPLLSLIDTAAVGIFSGTAQQAALNPAVAVTDYAALLIAFLYTGTTNLIAASHSKGNSEETAETFVGALQLSTWVGVCLGAVLLATARPAVLGLLGGSGSPTVISAALSYVRIRALGMPAAALIGSAQAASLGMQDVKSPLYVLAAAAGVNFLGDMILVNGMGAAGAAWATVASQYVAAALFWKWLTTRKVVPISKAIMEMTTGSGTPASAPRRKVPSVRGFLHNKLRPREIVRRQRLAATWKQFREYVVPVTSTQVGRVSGYVAMSHVVSSSLGTASMAAQQIIVSLFYCLTPIADSLSLTAQSFVPPIAEKDPSKARSKALRKTMRNLFKAGGVFGAIMVAAVSCIPLVSGLFTQDPVVASLVNMVTPLLVGVFSIHGIVCAAEGLLLGQKDLNFLGQMYAAFFAVVPLCMLRLKALPTTRLTSVWSVFLGYQGFRAVAWTIRALQLQRRAQRSD